MWNVLWLWLYDGSLEYLSSQVRKSSTKSWGTGSVFYPAGLPCWIQNQQWTMAKPWYKYHWLPYPFWTQSWKLVRAEFPSEFLRTKIGILHVLRVCFCWIQFDPDGGFLSHGGNPKSLRMGQWKPPDLKHQNSETGGLFLGARFQNGTRRRSGVTRNLRFATEMKKKHRRYGFSPWQIIGRSRVGNILLIYA